MPDAYAGWSREQLVERLLLLERPNDPQAEQTATPKAKVFDFMKYSRRKIALKFCYAGWEYGGLAYQALPGPLPTVEGVLFDALAKAHLVDPVSGFDGCGWERCGRTDRGVSAAGQVVSLWVRSALSNDSPGVMNVATVSELLKRTAIGPLSGRRCAIVDDKAEVERDDSLENTERPLSEAQSPTQQRRAALQTDLVTATQNEHDYMSILNRILPTTVRVLAWSPVRPEFSARFSCAYRHYKYFFCANGLDLSRMRDGASRLLGEHDFRNLCKLDPTKQIKNFRRNVLRADIEPVASMFDGSDPLNGQHVFNLVGSAFLYHQVRHIMAVLFLIGTGLEHPSVMSSLLNVQKDAEQKRQGDLDLEMVNCKPEYQMADALPLMLWDCRYGPKDLNWRISGRPNASHELSTVVIPNKENNGKLYHQMASMHGRSQIYTLLNQYFLAAAAEHHSPSVAPFPLLQGVCDGAPSRSTLKVPLGGGRFHKTSKYVPLLERTRLDSVEIANERWRIAQGFRRGERRMVGGNVEEDE